MTGCCKTGALSLAEKELVKIGGTYLGDLNFPTFWRLGWKLHEVIHLQPNLVLGPKLLEEVLVVLETAAVLVEVTAVVVAALELKNE